jgi:glycosidase
MPRSNAATPAWLEEAVFYQIYPQSFYDSNGDGVGDIPGIQQKLDYVESLGVKGVWLNPCFESPFLDAGYDVSDYYKVAPRYGTNDDLRRLLAEARKRDIRVLLDLVPGHTSTEHPWFEASCRHERNEYSDWYVWTNSVWESLVPGLRAVGGMAERDAAYIANFFYFQPALNYGFASPDRRQPWQQPVDAPGPRAVRREMRKVMEFWLDMGASGFRVDMAGSLVKNDFDGRETSQLWREARAWLEGDYPEAALVAEWAAPSLAIPAGFHADFYLPFGVPGAGSLFRKRFPDLGRSDPYGWSFFERSGHGNVREFLDEYLRQYEATKSQGFISLVSGNHDVIPRLSHGREADDLELAFLFLLTMPGLPFIYYGDEIGMRSVDGLPSKEGGYGRTQVRTPMQWDDSPNAGFSTAPADQLYLPIDPRPDRPTVAAQEDDSDSLLNRVRRIVALRRAHPALQASGAFAPVYAVAGECPFVYRRTKGDEDVLVAVNPSANAVEVPMPEGLLAAAPETLQGRDGAWVEEDGRWLLRLPGVAGGVYRLLREKGH